jgi:hypothetical protein
MHHSLVMKIKALLTVSLGLLASQVSAEVRTFLGSSRWDTTIFRTNTNTSVAKTSYTTFYLIEYVNGEIVDQMKIDAWSYKNPATRVTERVFLVDNDFGIEYAYFGIGNTTVAGGMKFGGIEAYSPFRGTLSFGGLGAFTLIPTADYYPFSIDNNPALDIISITGSARLNTSFSGPQSLGFFEQQVKSYLRSRGYFEVQ